jgi:hypothetical protein
VGICKVGDKRSFQSVTTALIFNGQGIPEEGLRQSQASIRPVHSSYERDVDTADILALCPCIQIDLDRDLSATLERNYLEEIPFSSFSAKLVESFESVNL